MPEATVSAGAIRYRDTGSGPPVLFVHGLLVDGELWRDVVAALDGQVRCIVPDLPLGAHRTAMRPEADLAPPAVADLIAEFMGSIGVEEATIVASDTGGAIAQMLAARHPERVTRLLLTPCDTYDNFLPPLFRPLQVAARVPVLLHALLTPMRIGAVRRAVFGLLAKRGVPRDLTDGWTERLLGDRGVRRDATKVTKGIRKRDLLDAVEQLKGFDQPVLIAFAPEDRFFRFDHAERMVRELPNARLERIEDSYAFAPLDQPERVAELVREFAAG